MDMGVIRLAPGPDARTRTLEAEIAMDILWAAAIPDDRLEHIRARPGPPPATLDIVVFLNCTVPVSATDLALRLCRRALLTAPVLNGWTAIPLSPTTHCMTWEIP